jgi:hypothetical protein
MADELKKTSEDDKLEDSQVDPDELFDGLGAIEE